MANNIFERGLAGAEQLIDAVTGEGGGCGYFCKISFRNISIFRFDNLIATLTKLRYISLI
jgi:hypothetical protein